MSEGKRIILGGKTPFFLEDGLCSFSPGASHRPLLCLSSLSPSAEEALCNRGRSKITPAEKVVGAQTKAASDAGAGSASWLII